MVWCKGSRAVRGTDGVVQKIAELSEVHRGTKDPWPSVNNSDWSRKKRKKKK